MTRTTTTTTATMLDTMRDIRAQLRATADPHAAIDHTDPIQAAALGCITDTDDTAPATVRDLIHALTDEINALYWDVQPAPATTRPVYTATVDQQATCDACTAACLAWVEAGMDPATDPCHHCVGCPYEDTEATKAAHTTKAGYQRQHRAQRIAATLRWYADDPDTDDLCGAGYSDGLRALADRLEDGTATDDDWQRAVAECDPRV